MTLAITAFQVVEINSASIFWRRKLSPRESEEGEWQNQGPPLSPKFHEILEASFSGDKAVLASAYRMELGKWAEEKSQRNKNCFSWIVCPPVG